MVDAKAMRDISDARHQELVNEDIITLTQAVESAISEAANKGHYSVTVDIVGIYNEAIEAVRQKLEEFCYETSLMALICSPSELRISW